MAKITLLGKTVHQLPSTKLQIVGGTKKRVFAYQFNAESGLYDVGYLGRGQSSPFEVTSYVTERRKAKRAALDNFAAYLVRQRGAK